MDPIASHSCGTPARPRTLVQVGPRRDASGGIASVLRLIEDEARGLAERVVFVGTVGDGSAAVRSIDSLTGLVRAAVAVVANPDAVFHVHLSQRGSHARKSLVVRVATALGRRVVVHVHGSEFDSWAAGDERRLRAVRRTLESADVVVALSEAWRSRLLAVAPGARVTVVPNAVTLPPLLPPGERTGVVFAGRLERRKGVFVLLEAIERLQAEGGEDAFVLAGDGDVAAVRAAVARLPRPDLVEVTGWLDADALREKLAYARAFVLPSFEEGLPMALLEAMSFGVACVSTPVGGIPEVIEDGVNGLLVPAGDAQALAGAIRTVLADGAFAQRIGMAARDTIEREYSAGRFVQDLAAVYAEVLGRKRASA